jgi:hypothetical protein
VEARNNQCLCRAPARQNRPFCPIHRHLRHTCEFGPVRGFRDCLQLEFNGTLCLREQPSFQPIGIVTPTTSLSGKRRAWQTTSHNVGGLPRSRPSGRTHLKSGPSRKIVWRVFTWTGLRGASASLFLGKLSRPLLLIKGLSLPQGRLVSAYISAIHILRYYIHS